MILPSKTTSRKLSIQNWASLQFSEAIWAGRWAGQRLRLKICYLNKVEAVPRFLCVYVYTSWPQLLKKTRTIFSLALDFFPEKIKSLKKIVFWLHSMRPETSQNVSITSQKILRN